MSSLQNGHGRDGGRPQSTNVDDQAEGEAVGEVVADIEVEGEYGIRYGREASKDNGEGRKSEDGCYEEGGQEESKQEGFFLSSFPFEPLVRLLRLGAQVLLHAGLGDHDKGGGHGEEFALASVEPDEEHEDELVSRLKGALGGGHHY